ncbi:hypothetical protein L1987_62352 [Smallanthus sonchifolius]|uniref:Uncharacterized protein n=1 Tax=Smallanthus sonchifolius TaxID=185202 RepID=A0ACB9CA62_9ASTR|nr:hypothetical protein L1987_62352 [Smallanthus sonchifolius]
MMYVGDSLNRGQYVSLVCLLHSLIPDHAKSMETFGSLTVFTAKDYNATIEFYWAPFLLEQTPTMRWFIAYLIEWHGSFDDEVKEIVQVSTEDAYRMGMKSMLKWVEKNMNPERTRVFFTGMSPSHFKKDAHTHVNLQEAMEPFDTTTNSQSYYLCRLHTLASKIHLLFVKLFYP